MEVSVFLQKCPSSKRMCGIRIQKMDDGDWWRTWAFKVDPEQAQREKFDQNTIQGNLWYTDEFPGCPHCGAMSFVQCGTCKKISCFKGEEKEVPCLWCGTLMQNITTVESKFDVTSGQS